QVQGKISIAQKGLSDIARISATDHYPRRAAQLATTFAEEYIRFRRSADRAKILEAQRLTRRQLATLSPVARNLSNVRELKQRINQLTTLAALQTGNAELVQAAPVPGTPSSPRPVRATVIALVVGILLGIIIAVLVTSAAPGDGKSTVAANLVAAAAGAGMRALLLEVDLRHPSVAPGLGIRRAPGLTHVLAKGAKLGDVAQVVPAGEGQFGSSSSQTMDVIVAGPLPPNPTDLLESHRM